MEGPRLIPQVIPWRRENGTRYVDYTTTRSTACSAFIVCLLYLTRIIGVPRSKN